MRIVGAIATLLAATTTVLAGDIGTVLKSNDQSYALRRSPAAVAVQPQAGAGGTAYGWSGYAVNAQAYTSASGSWTVPAVSYENYPGSSQAEFSAAWVGIGGNGSDQSLIQLGTAQNISPTEVKYYAWYLLVQGTNVAATPLPDPVSPGDQITASLQCVANCVPNAQQSWLLTIRNSTKNWTWNNNGQPFSYQSSMASAEWIMEDPILQQPGALPNLPKFGSVTFTGVTANGANPNLSLATDAITLIAADGSPLAIPTAATGGNSFTVNQVGLPPAVPLPNQPTMGYCTSGPNFGELESNPQFPQGALQGFGQVFLYGFYLTHYASMTLLPQQFVPPKYSYVFIDDVTGNSLATQQGTGAAPVFVSLDPGYYCLKIFNPQVLTGVQYRMSLSDQRMGLPPGTTTQNAPPLPAMDIGNLTPNGYYGQSRYINANNPAVRPTLVPDHIYTLRDWVGTAGPDQWYIFSLDATRAMTMDVGNLYLGARVTIETASGGVVAESADVGQSLIGRAPNQHFNGALPAGTYYLHIKFADVGGPGTPYAVSLTAH